MSSTSIRRPPGSIQKIREFELEKVHLADEFDILQIVGEGWFGKILLVEHRATDTEMVLKALPKPYVSLRDFYREFHYGLHLGVHKNIVTTYDVAFETAGFYVFTQEYAPLGDLTSNISESGIGDLHSKRVAKQIASALDYMHSKDIVHRDVKLDNVLIYRSDFSRVKLCDFGESFRTGTIVERRNEWLPYSPPEVLEVKPEDTYKADPSHDVWQFGIVIFVCLTGCLPWQRADTSDPRYSRYLLWHGTNVMLPLRRTPKLFKLLSSKAARMFKKFLEPKHERRPKNFSDLARFIEDRWLTKSAEKDLCENESDVLCPSMYSYHSCPEEKNRLLSTLAEHGIETTVDRVSKKARIRDWIEASVITEEDEEDSGTGTPSSSLSREPVAGHISSVKDEANNKKIVTTIKDASNKHFDPRTGVVQQGPSTMGTPYKSLSVVDISKNVSFSEVNQQKSLSVFSLVPATSTSSLLSNQDQNDSTNWNMYGLSNNFNQKSNSYNNKNYKIINKDNNSDDNFSDMNFVYRKNLNKSTTNLSNLSTQTLNSNIYDDDEDIDKNSSDKTLISSNFNSSLKNINKNPRNNYNYPTQSMKDTPYDYIKIKK